MSTRILVTGKYENPSTYTLKEEDGSVFLTLHEGEEFYVSNQMRPYVPERIPKKNGKGTILMCRKYRNCGYILDEFPLPHNKKGLWALTSGAARNGVFHWYTEPKNELEKQLKLMSVSPSIVKRVDKINKIFEIGGELCSHCPNRHGYGAISDGDWEDLEEPMYAPDNHPNQYHRGCQISSAKSRCYDATYVIYCTLSERGMGLHWQPTEILLTPEADEAKVLEELRKL